jgi:NDP-sugar pyrophosphorylase family protein
MKAMILAAGLGTRLRPLTDTRPKALVEISGRTLLEITLTRLRAFGITEVIINVHHFADQVIDYLKSHNNFGLRIEISREDVLLDTGGGLKKAAWFFLEDPARLAHSRTQLTNDSRQGTASAVPKGPGVSRASAPEAGGLSRPVIYDEPFLLHNVDIISNIDFARMLQFHTENHALATVAVQSRETSRPLLFDGHNQLRGRRIDNKDTLVSQPPETTNNCHSERSEESAFSSHSPLATHHSPLPLAFSGIHIISPRLLPLLTEEGIFSIIPSYVRLSAQSQKILAFRADQYYWRDLGRPADLAQAAEDMKKGALKQ